MPVQKLLINRESIRKVMDNRCYHVTLYFDADLYQHLPEAEKEFAFVTEDGHYKYCRTYINQIPSGLETFINNHGGDLLGSNIYTDAPLYSTKDISANMKYLYSYDYDMIITCDFCGHKTNFQNLETYEFEDEENDIFIYRSKVCPNCKEPDCVQIVHEHLTDHEIDNLIQNNHITIT